MCGFKGACIECADSADRVPIGWDRIEGDGPDVSDEQLDEFLSGGKIDYNG